MTKDEALKMAINAMIKPDNLSFLMAITACQDALGQPTVKELNDEYLRDTYVEGLNQPAWQGLTDDEIAKSIVTRGVPNCDWNEVTIDYLKEDIVAIARAIEQALKDKNSI